MAAITYVSVVRDPEMYRKCIQSNPACIGREMVMFDNREKNEHIPTLYNRFLRSRPSDEDAWYVFCHEDFQPKEPLEPLVDKLDKNALWGPIGAVTKRCFLIYEKWELKGEIEGCSRIGENCRKIGSPAPLGTQVDTFDCQCLVVHSSLLQRTGLRFDEKLSYDLYLEDLCINAQENFNITPRILPLKCRHWSESTAQARYYTQKSYLDKKYPSCSYTGICSWSIGGRPSILRRFNITVKTCVMKLMRLLKV